MFLYHIKVGQFKLRPAMRFFCNVLLWIGLLFFFQSAVVARENNALNKTLRYSVLPDSSQEIIDSRFSPLISYLKREAGIEFEYVKASNYQGLVKLFIDKKIE